MTRLDIDRLLFRTMKITALDQKQPLTERLGVMDQGSCLVKIKDRDELKN
jgi:hypothetical protein